MRVVARVNDLGALRELSAQQHGEIEMAFFDQLGHLPIKKGDQQRGDMRAVDIGVGHHDNLIITQILVAIMRTEAAAERLRQIRELLIGRELVARRRSDVENFPAQRQHRLIHAVSPFLGRAAGRIALDDEQLRPLRRIIGAVDKLAGQSQFARRALAGDILFGAAAQPFLGPFDREIEKLRRLRRRAGEPMVEGVTHAGLDDARRLHAHQPALVLALKLRLADEHRNHRRRLSHQIVAGDVLGAPRLTTRSAWSLRPRSSARRKPASCVPPSGVGMVLQ